MTGRLPSESFRIGYKTEVEVCSDAVEEFHLSNMIVCHRVVGSSGLVLIYVHEMRPEDSK
jgi:hypothetical protein